MVERHALFIYSDGGPDHRLTYVSVQLSLIALFLNLDLDLLVAARTAPSHSWANPVERVMSTINLGLQCVGVMRKKIEEKDEVFERSKNLKELRANCIDHKDAVAQTLKPVKDLIESILQRLELKEKKFTIFHSASEWQIEQFWEILLQVSKIIIHCHGTFICLHCYYYNCYVYYCDCYYYYSLLNIEIRWTEAQIFLLHLLFLHSWCYRAIVWLLTSYMTLWSECTLHSSFICISF